MKLRLFVVILAFLFSGLRIFSQAPYTYPRHHRAAAFSSQNNILYVDGVTYTATELGSTLNTMYAALPSNGGTIVIPPQSACYTMSTQAAFNTAAKPVTIDGVGGTCINWTPTTGTAFIFNNGDLSNLHLRSGGFRNLVLNGPASGTAVGVFLGGANGAEGWSAFGSKIFFPSGTSILFGNNTWGTSVDHTTVIGAPAINFPGSLTNSGEDIQLLGATLQGQGGNYANCAIFNGGSGLQLSLIGGEFDDCQLTMTSGVSTILNTHFENPGMNSDSTSNPAIILGGNSTLTGIETLQDASSGVTKSQEISITGNAQAYLVGGSFTSNATIANLLTNSGSNTVFIAPGNVGGFTNHSNTTSTGRVSEFPVYGLSGIRSCTQTSGGTFCNQLPPVTGTLSQVTVEYCGATTGGTQACAGTIQNLPLVAWGDVLLNAAATQSITTMPFTDALYSCSGSDLTTAAGIVSFNTYASASVTIQESGGTTSDHLRYECVGH